mmetsp:Transcript_34092/g.76753  ORF Transcript_34092/g.76753 Transcript_34092/m.76753 type:complete len:1260 (-) Transcript_34092:158-3937(-)
MKVEDEEFEDFVDRVDEVEKTIKALLDGKIDVESVDRKEQEIRRKQQETEEKKKKKLEEQRKLAKRMERNQERKKWGFAGRWCPRCRRDEYKILEDVYGPDESNWPEEIPPTCFSTQCKDVEPPVRLLSPEERRQELQHKVEELKEERVKKALARDRWNKWKSTQKYNRAGVEWEECYERWDKWLPSDDDEDELPPAPPPDTPEFRAMEKDIEDRAKAKGERQKKGEEWKLKGNEAMQEGEFVKAFKLYTKGIQEDKSSRALLTNRALCCLKLNNKKMKIEKLGEEIYVESFTQAIDDCTKVLDICEFLHDNKGPGIKQSQLKAYMRRAEAFCKTNRLQEAIKDMERALDEIKFLSSSEKQELAALKQKFHDELQEKERLQEMRKAAGLQVNAEESRPSEIEHEHEHEQEEGEEEGGKGVDGMDADAMPKSEGSEKDELWQSQIQEIEEQDNTGQQGRPKCINPGSHMATESQDNKKLGEEEHCKFVVGEKVAITTQTSETVEGVIAFDNEDGSYDVVCDDGSDRDGVAASRLSRILPDGRAEGNETRSGGTKESDGADGDVQKAAEAKRDSAKTANKTAMRKVVVVEEEEEEEEEASTAASQPSKSSSSHESGAKTSRAPALDDGDFRSDIYKLMKDPNLKSFVDEILSSGKVLSDEEILKRYGDRDEVMHLYSMMEKLSKSAEVEQIQQTMDKQREEMGLHKEQVDLLLKDPALESVLKDKETWNKLQSLMVDRDPKKFEEAISKDPALRGLEETLQKVLQEKILKKGEDGEKPLSPEERLQVAVKSLGGVKEFVQALKQRGKGPGSPPEDLEVQAKRLLLSLTDMTSNDDVCTLLRDEGCVETICDVINKHAAVGDKQLLLPTLLVLSNMIQQKKSADALLEHARGATLVLVVSWAQGVTYEEEVSERCLQLLEIGTEHATMRSFLARKQWNLTLPGETEPRRISLLHAATRTLRTGNQGLLHPGVGCLANILFDDKGKSNFLEFAEKENGELIGNLKQVLAGSSSKSHLKVWRFFLNATTHSGIREWIRRQGMICEIIRESFRSCLHRIPAQDQLASAELETILGVIINLTSDENFIAELHQHGVMSLLQDSLSACSEAGCTSRGLAAAARIARHAGAAEEAIRVGVYDTFLHKIKGHGDVSADDVDHCVRGVAQCLKVAAASAGERLMQEEGAVPVTRALPILSPTHAHSAFRPCSLSSPAAASMQSATRRLRSKCLRARRRICMRWVKPAACRRCYKLFTTSADLRRRTLLLR